MILLHPERLDEQPPTSLRSKISDLGQTPSGSHLVVQLQQINIEADGDAIRNPARVEHAQSVEVREAAHEQAHHVMSAPRCL